MNLLRLTFIFVIISSCSLQKDRQDFAANEIKVVKFLNISDYPVDIYDKIFWENPDEHAFFYMRHHLGLIEDIKHLKETDGKNFNFMTYAFLVKNASTIDTLYLDDSLKVWQHKKKYYHDEDNKIYDYLKNHPFFYQCK